MALPLWPWDWHLHNQGNVTDNKKENVFISEDIGILDLLFSDNMSLHYMHLTRHVSYCTVFPNVE